MKFLALLLTVLSLTACAPRGDFTRLADIPAEKAVNVQAVGKSETVFVGTSRRYENGAFGFARSYQPSFMRYDISVPNAREPGEVIWPRNANRADPAKDFITLSDKVYADRKVFEGELRRSLGRKGQRDVVVYVHGFNNTLAESVYRVAQMHHDLNVPGVAVHYAWPSRGSALGYVYDRDSSLFGRDGFEQLLQSVVRAGGERVIIVAHSMGSALTMETLRQSAIRGDKQVMNAVNGVILISPDLDVDLFRSQAQDMGKLPQPFLIFGNTRDSVLGISSRLAGAPDRLGNLGDLQQLADLNVTFYDTANYSQGAGHNNLGTSPALLKLLGGIGSLDRAFSAEARSRVGLLPGVVLTARNATSIVLSPVEALATGDFDGDGRPRPITPPPAGSTPIAAPAP